MRRLQRCRLDMQATNRPISGHCRTADRKRGPLASIPDSPIGIRNTVRLRLAAVFSSFLSAARPLPSLLSSHIWLVSGRHLLFLFLLLFYCFNVGVGFSLGFALKYIPYLCIARGQPSCSPTSPLPPLPLAHESRRHDSAHT